VKKTVTAKKYASLAAYLEDTETTHDALAERLGISRSYVTLLASGDRQPALDLAIRIEEATGVPVASLVSERASA
jgi:transcriptional regulator with XRE-family HTH domain